MRYLRKIIHIRAEDSPNVKLALEQRSRGQEPTGELVLPGVLSWADYCKRRAIWSPQRQCVGLDGVFYEGSEELLFPPQWLNRAEEVARNKPLSGRSAKGMGIDPGEGEANSSWTVTDEFGILFQRSFRTTDTTIIVDTTIELIKRFHVPCDRICFDRGGGGKQHADRLRVLGYPVRTVGFGETIILEPKRGLVRVEDKKEQREEHYAFTNRRSQMFGEASMLLDPTLNPEGYGIPAEYAELRRQLDMIPKWYDGEGRLLLPPKNKRPDMKGQGQKRTLIEIIGHSPDEADSWVLAVHAMLHKSKRAIAGAIV